MYEYYYEEEFETYYIKPVNGDFDVDSAKTEEEAKTKTEQWNNNKKDQ